MLMSFFWVVTPSGLVGTYQILALKMETVYTSETFISAYNITLSEGSKNN
jgi:hypothetical protein